MPFFIRGKGRSASQKKRLLKGVKRKPHDKKENEILLSKKHKRRDEEKEEEEEDEDITSEEDEFFNQYKNKEETPYIPKEEETAQEKKVRLANQYLRELKMQKEEEEEDYEEVHRAVGLQLKKDVLEAAGKLQHFIADSFEFPDLLQMKMLKCKQHKRSLTCLVVSSDEKLIFTASKDCTIVKWNILGERLGVIRRDQISEQGKFVGHKSNILSLALSSDSKFLVSGDVDGVMRVWDPESLTLLKTFRKHRGAISGVAFRKGSHMLFSASHDRLVMTWDLDSMAFAESFGGHQDPITGLDALMKESCITSGGRDEMVIIYVIPEEKQLRFSSTQVSIDGVKLVNEKTFITYGQNGSLALWSTMKKKPYFTLGLAHGRSPENREPYWLTAAAACTNTDVVASGSYDGNVKLWKIDHEKRILSAMFSIPVPGVVNGLEFTCSGSHLIAAVGQEHKLGRWYSLKSSPNALFIIPLKRKPK